MALILPGHWSALVVAVVAVVVVAAVAAVAVVAVVVVEPSMSSVLCFGSSRTAGDTQTT